MKRGYPIFEASRLVLLKHVFLQAALVLDLIVSSILLFQQRQSVAHRIVNVDVVSYN